MLCFDIGVDLQASSYKIELDLISINACLSPSQPRSPKIDDSLYNIYSCMFEFSHMSIQSWTKKVLPYHINFFLVSAIGLVLSCIIFTALTVCTSLTKSCPIPQRAIHTPHIQHHPSPQIISSPIRC